MLPGLYIVATPIGNLADITLRALEILKNSDLIVCEDTRRTGILLKHYGISNKMLLSYHDYNKEKRTPEIIQFLKGGKRVSLVSDSGTPGISDPGFYLIRECIRQGINLVPVPGPSAVITALVVSGLPCDRFVYEGFLSHREGRKRKKLLSLINEERTMVFYEAPSRILKTLRIIKEIFGERECVICRELTKRFEEVIRGKVSEIISTLEKRERIKGEIVIVLKGKE
uniref:Ribosomal RNA small subunit methyltransferase I n=1 Tax=candidate division WOR-3 bacterium TaxID=2052148 RepID=A0A7C3YT40_UNCW3